MVIDPTGGLLIELEDFVSDDRVAGHFNTFHHYFGYEGTHHYDGTIFRFPLRTGSYKTLLPNTIYNTEKVLSDLFGPFKQEIENCLLFMKSVHTVRVSVKDDKGIRLLYSVEVDGSFGEKLNLHRKEMFDFIENEYYLQSSRIFISIFPTCFIDFDQNTRGHLWLVMNMLGLTDKVSTSQVGKSNPVCVDSYLPWLAIALPLPHSQHTLDALKDQNCWSHEFTDTVRFVKLINTCMPTIPLSCELLDFVGNLFCFLPIAATSKFPFHIHGYFALSTNRRSIKWPRFDDLSDEAKWNKELVWNLGTTLYAALIHLMISRFHVEGSSRCHYSLWSCLPSNSEADELQRILHSGALDILQSSKLVFSEFNAAWIGLSDGYYLPSLFGETISHESVCHDMLLHLSQPLVDLTPEVAEVIKMYQPLRKKISNRIINPDLIRQMLIRFQSTETVLDFLRNKHNVYSLLEIVLSDLVFSPQHLPHKLDGIRLIPVCDSDLPMFFGRDSYFISEGSQNLLTLFPGLDRNFVRPSLPHHISSSLLKLSRTGLINIQDISKIRNNPQIFIQLLERSMNTFFNLKSPIVWTPGVNNQPENTWIEQLWKFIGQEHTLITALKKNQIPILPKQSLDASEIDLLPLSTTPMPYLEECTTSTHEQIERLIASSGCHICHRHAFILPFSNFVSPPIPQGFFSILKSQTIRRKFLHTISNAKDSIKQSLIKLILSAGLSNNEETNITKSFPIFKSMSGHWIALDPKQCYYLPPNTIPHDFNSYPQNFLNPFDHQNIELCWKVGVTTLSLDETIQHHLLPLMTSNALCNQPKERNQLSLWLLRNYSLFDQNVISTLTTSKWLIDSSVNPNQSLKKPSGLFSPAELFDPQDAIFSYLVPPCTRGMFPNELYHEHINTLKLLGLVSSKKLDDLNLQNVVKLALQNTAFKNCAEFEFWMNALVDLINLHMNNLNLPNNASFWNLFKKTAFIFPSSKNECTNYPKCLPFFASANKLFKPDGIIICSDRDSCLIAGVAPLLVDKSGTNKNHREIYRLMGFQTNISIKLVCQQLTVTTKQKDIDHSEIHSYMKKIYKHFAYIISSNKDLIKLINLPNKFVFIPKFGFYDCQYVVFSCDDALFPHIFSLEKYYPTYEENLAEFFRTFKIESEVGFSKCQFVLQRLQKSLLPPDEVNLAIKLIQLSADSMKNVATKKNCFMLAQDCQIHSSVQCVFNDLPWLKRSQILTDKPIVHSEISNLIADKFGCLPASSELTPTATSISYSFISGAGQRENLVKRLKNILEGYRAQSDVFLELIQNSDDAGAKQVKILFDYTSHPSTSVLHRNMEKIQGPALYLFNDSMFTALDFESILELSSGNKLNETTKIGRFGVGFNAVYNFTDCPSFVSSNLVQIFDPLRKYLGQITQDSGVRICFTDDEAAVSTYQDQFKVYHGIFNCNILNREPYECTLFRLPFRLTPSKLSSQTFNNEEIARIQTDILKELPQLILFLQNIANIEVYEKKESGLPLKKLLTVSKSECSTTHFLQNNTKYFKTYLDLVRDGYKPDNVIKSCDVVSICSKFPTGEISQDFLISYASGIQECFYVLRRFNPSDITFLPLCGVAIPLSYTQTPNDSQFNIYTFLPLLHIRSPLLLHINGCFSLSSSRKNLSDFDRPESRGSSDLRTDWNLALINDALANALVYALEVLPRLEPLSSSCQLKNIFSYYSLWPVKNNTNILWKRFPEFFVKRIDQFFPSTRLFSSAHDPSSWVALDQISFLSLKENVSTKCEFMKFIFDLSYQHGIIFANFPSFFSSTVLYKVFSELKPKKVFDLRKICELVIFPSLGGLPLESIIIVFNSLIPLCNEESESWLLKSLCDIAFIPCGSNGKDFKLRIPSKVVCPNTKLTSLYKCDEMRIPVRELHDKFDFNKPDLFINVLKRMDVIHSKLPECEVISRCDVTSKLTTDSATRHATTLIKYLSQEEDSFFKSVFPKIKSIPFIPTYRDSILDVLSITHTRLVSPDRCYAFSCRNLISPLHSCVSENLFYLSSKFSISSTPTLDVVLQVLQTLISKQDLIREKSFKIDERILEIYKFISEEVKKESKVALDVKAKMEGRPWIWHPDYKQFYISNKVVLSTEFRTLAKNKYIVSFPYTDSLRDENFKAFLINVGVKDKVDDIMIMNCLEMIQEEFQDRRLEPNLVKLVLTLIESIDNCPDCKNKVFILNQMDTLHRPDELYIQLSPHFEQEDSGKFVHSDINQLRALKLGAKTSEELFSKNTDFEESDFGVEEEITDRIQSLVRDIPKDALIKELIQNADDAEATEIVFILDEQDYSSFDKTLSLPEKEYPNWKYLNTIPSLSVYNNKGFSVEDFKGIQTLSVGGKTQNRKSIGKFGVGFNSVYQITDTPTFITSQSGSQGLTLCCIDPFIKYTVKLSETENSRKKRGKRFDIPSHNIDKFTDQLHPFKFTKHRENPKISQSLANLWDDGEFTMFRFPLDICRCHQIRQNVPYSKGESRKPYSPKMVMDILSNHVKNSSEILLFLNHVQSLKVISIDRYGELKLEYSQSFRLIGPTHQPIPDYFPLANIAKDIKIQEKKCVNTHGSSTRVSKYRIYSFPDIPIDQFVAGIPELNEFLGKYNEEKLWGCGGIAVCISPFGCTMQSNIFTFLPFAKDKYPVHINAPLIFDASRQHFFTNQSSPWAEAWHSSIIKYILAPLYTLVVLDLQAPFKPVETVEEKREYFDWFYHLFPDKSNTHQFLTKLSEEFYAFLYRTNQPILLRDNLDFSDELKWYSLHGDNCGVLKPIFFPFTSKMTHEISAVETNEYKFQVSTPYLESAQQTEMLNASAKRDKEKDFRRSLILIQFPLSHAPARLFDCFNLLKLIRLDQSFLLNYLRDNIHSLFHENTYPCNINSSLLNFQQFRIILEYILSANEELFRDFPSIPLRIDIGDNIRCFRKDKPSYRHKYSLLIPHCSESFISSKYDSSILHRLSSLGYVKDLTCDYLAKHLDVERFEDKKQYSLFWEFVVENKVSEEDLNKFYNHKLVPLIPSQPSDFSFFPVNRLKFVVSETLNDPLKDKVLFTALKTLGCPFVSFDFFSKLIDNNIPLIARIKSYLDKFVISQLRHPDIILGSVSFSSNLSAELGSEEEAFKLYQIFSQINPNQCSKEQLLILSQLKIFKTLAGDHLSLSQCEICFMNTEKLILGPKILELLQTNYKLVIFQFYSGDFFKSMCALLNKEFVDVNGLLLNYVLKHLYQIPLGEQKKILRFISHLTGGGSISKIRNLITGLMEVPFIQIENRSFKVSELYSPKLEFVKRFLSDRALPEDWDKKYFTQLFSALGLRDEITLDDILIVALKFQRRELPTEYLHSLLQSLLLILLNLTSQIDQHSAYVLRQIGEVRFLPAWKLKNVHTNQKTYSSDLVRFCDAQLIEFQHCCSTTALIHELNFEIPEDFYQYLNIAQYPPPQLIKVHLLNVTNQILHQYHQSEIPANLHEFFYSSYKYLEAFSAQITYAEFLNLPCILVNSKLYYPVNMLFTSSEELTPFVLQLPPSLASLCPIFLENIGVEKKASHRHFAFILCEIHASIQARGIELKDNKMYLFQAEIVFNRLINDLRELEVRSTPLNLNLTNIVLLANYSQLSPCADVIFGDNPLLLSRINKLQLQFNILKPLEPDQNKSCVPPACLKLRRLTEFVREEIDPNVYNNMIVPSGNCLSNRLRDILKSQIVLRAMRRLYFHLTKKDLEIVLLKNGETCIDDNQPHPGFLSVSQLFNNLEILCVNQIDILIRDFRTAPPKVYQLSNSSGAFIDANDKFLISNHPLKQSCIYKDISYAVNAYLGNLFTEVLSFFELCFMLDPNELMDKLDEYNIAIDPWYVPQPPVTAMPVPLVPPSTLPPINVPNYPVPPAVPYAPSIPVPRPRPIPMLGKQDVAAAKLWLRVSQCDLLAAKRLITQNENDQHLFPAHACFCCFESVIKAFISLLHYKGSKDRLVFERNLRVYFDYLPFLFPSKPQFHSEIEQLAIPLINYEMETRIPSATCTPGMGSYIPQQIFTEEQAREAIRNATRLIKLFMKEFPELRECILSEDDPILKCLPSPNPPLITAILSCKYYLY